MSQRYLLGRFLRDKNPIRRKGSHVQDRGVGRRVSYWVTDDVRLIRQTLTKKPADQKADIEAAGHKAIKSYNQTDFVRNRVAIEVQLGKYAFVAYDLFVKHLAFYVQDEIDVGIEILPTKLMQQQMSFGIAYYEGELYNVIRNGRSVPAVPLVILGMRRNTPDVRLIEVSLPPRVKSSMRRRSTRNRGSSARASIMMCFAFTNRTRRS